MNKNFVIIALIASIIGVSWLLSRSLHMQEESKPKPTTGITQKITIWIHGTRGSEIFPVGISKATKQIEQNICTAPLGLHKASEIDPKFHNQAIAQYLSHADKEQFPFKHFYSFGWSGELAPLARKKAAEQLYGQLKQLILNYVVQYAAQPEITLITHSHGGNVALNLASIVEENSPVIIDQLILLACPVQQETAALVDSQLFKSVIAIHSHADAIQVLDPQGLHPIKEGIKESWNNGSLKPLAHATKESSKIPLFSERHFASTKVKHIMTNWKKNAPWSQDDLKPFGSLKDVIKKWALLDTNPRGLLHIEFLLHSFLSQLPEIIKMNQKTDTFELEVFLPEIQPLEVI